MAEYTIRPRSDLVKKCLLTCVSDCLFVCLFACLFTYLRTYLFVYLLAYLLTYLSICLCARLFVCLFVCFFVCLFVCSFVCLFVCLFVHSFVPYCPEALILANQTLISQQRRIRYRKVGTRKRKVLPLMLYFVDVLLVGLTTTTSVFDLGDSSETGANSSLIWNSISCWPYSDRRPSATSRSAAVPRF